MWENHVLHLNLLSLANSLHKPKILHFTPWTDFNMLLSHLKCIPVWMSASVIVACNALVFG